MRRVQSRKRRLPLRKMKKRPRVLKRKSNNQPRPQDLEINEAVRSIKRKRSQKKRKKNKNKNRVKNQNEVPRINLLEVRGNSNHPGLGRVQRKKKRNLRKKKNLSNRKRRKKKNQKRKSQLEDQGELHRGNHQLKIKRRRCQPSKKRRKARTPSLATRNQNLL